jgi:succinyl-CoA synthetase alpha subunit
MLVADSETRGVVMIGEIGGDAEVKGAEFLKASKTRKPVVGFIAGRTAPPGRRMGHAGAVISGGHDTAEFKVEVMRSAGIRVADSPAALGEEMLKAMKG